jgi:hypothetical protein
MTDFPRFTYSMKDVRRAGEVIAGDLTWTDETAPKIREAFAIANNYRDSHAYPMRSLRGSIRWYMQVKGLEGVVAARLKRMQAIRRKLARMSLHLNQLQDLGGCRAILNSISDVRSLVELLSQCRHELRAETTKLARRPTKGTPTTESINADRAKFMQSMAWWILNVEKENRFLPEEIPIDMVPQSIRSGRGRETAIREAIVGSVIEPVSDMGVLGRKAKKYFFFPHKSYLEFLVANHFQSNLFSTDMYREFMQNINNEILTFLEEGPVSGIQLLRQGLTHTMGTIDLRIIEACLKDNNIEDEIETAKKKHVSYASDIYTHYFYLVRRSVDPESYLLGRIRDSRSVENAAATFNCVGAQLSISGSERLARALVLNCLTNIPIHSVRDVIQRDEEIKIYRPDTEGLRAAVVSDSIRIGGTRKEIVLNLDSLAAVMQRASRHSIFVTIPILKKANTRVRLSYDFIKPALPEDWVDPLEQLFKRYSATAGKLPISLLGDAAEWFG